MKRTIVFGSALLFLSGCQSLPEPSSPLGWLPPDFKTAVLLHVEGNEELTDILVTLTGLDPAGFKPLRERVTMMAMSIEDARVPDASPPVHLAALGRWPRGFISSSLASPWTKSPDLRHGWSGPGDLQLAAPSNQEMILSSGKRDIMMSRRLSGAVFPEPSPVEDPDLALWMHEPAGPSHPPFDLVKTMTVSFIRGVDGYEALVILHLRDPALGASLIFPMRLALAARFGLSPDARLRSLLDGLIIEEGPEGLSLFLPSLSLDVLEILLAQVLSDVKIQPW